MNAPEIVVQPPGSADRRLPATASPQCSSEADVEATCNARHALGPAARLDPSAEDLTGPCSDRQQADALAKGLAEALSQALSHHLAPLLEELAGLRTELAGLRSELGALRQRFPERSPALDATAAARPEPAGAGMSAAAETERVAEIRLKAAGLQNRLRQGLSQGMDPAEDAALDLLIDQMHDLAGEL